MTDDVEETAFEMKYEQGIAQPWPWPVFLAELEAKFIETMPEQYRATAQVRLYSYDKDAFLEVFYLRPETEAEAAERVAFESAQDERKRTWEMGELRRLQAKYKWMQPE